MSGRKPWGLRWRSSFWFVTLVVGLGILYLSCSPSSTIAGIATDLLVYSIIIPVLPFRLESLGYNGVSGLVGWLLFAYSGGLALSTIPAAIYSERYSSRQIPLVAGIVVLIGSQIMLMEAPTFTVMVLSRVLQGIGSTMVWVVGLALICDSTPTQHIGRQLGLSMTGLTAGYLVGPSSGGALYARFGFRGPFIFSIAVAVLDLIGRLLIIEHKTALRWGVDPATSEPTVQTTDTKLPFVSVMRRLSKSPRAFASFVITLVYGIVYSSQEPVLPLHLQMVWALGSSEAGVVFLAAAVPTLFSTTISGWSSDRFGQESICLLCLLLSLPWWSVVIIEGPLALFVTSFALQNFFTSGAIAPLTSELAAVSRDIEGIGYAHVYAAFNLSYGIGTSIGPIVGGQIYDHIQNGWMALCLIATGMIFFSTVLVLVYMGNNSFGKRLVRHFQVWTGDSGSS